MGQSEVAWVRIISVRESTIQARTVCPVCFTIFPKGKIHADYPTCPHCDSEAIGVDVVPLDEFLAQTPLEELQRIASEWDAATGFYEAYKREKATKIAALIKRKSTG